MGPGTFTGLRIGIATAQALARAREIDLVGVSTLHSLARGAGAAPAASDDAVMAVIDARRGEVFAAGWAAQDVTRPGAAPVLGPRALAPDALAQAMALRRPRVVGGGRRGGRIQRGSRACGSADS